MISPARQRSKGPVIFVNSEFRHGDLAGLDQDYSMGNILPLDVRTEIVDLHKELQVSTTIQQRIDLQRVIDRYLLVVPLFTTDSQLSLLMDREHFMLDGSISLIPSYDIGSIIRDIILNVEYQGTSVMFKIVQYCIPYIKHNRLNFPDYKMLSRDDLVAMMQIILATCLGVYDHVQRKPTFNIRISFFWMAWQILESGNEFDMYIFCRDHVSILRLSVIEYFVFFLTQNMPVENAFMHRILGFSSKIESVFTQFLLVIDNFRATALQDPVFDMRLVNTKAQYAIDKCNRVCKGKSRNVCRSTPTVKTHFENEIIKQAVSMPVLKTSLDFEVYCDHKKIRHFELIHLAQSTFRLHTLPMNLLMMQREAVLRNASSNSLSAYSSVFFYYCLHCQEQNPAAILGSRMRVKDNVVSCLACSQSDTVLKINTFGRIVSINSNSFYYCIQCFTHHSWREHPPNLMACQKNAREGSAKLSPQCLFCSKMSNTSQLQVLDDELGLQHSVSLCAQHRPPAHEEHIIDNVDSLLQYVDDKKQSRSKHRNSA